MHAVDAAILALFVAYAVGAGLRSRKQASRGLESYFLADRSLPGWQAGMSMAATQFAADTPLVVTGLIATAGLFSLWQLWSYGLAFLMLGFVFAPGWRRAGVLTDAEFSELRYSGRGALLLRSTRALLFGIGFNCVVVAMVLFAATFFAERLLFWNEWLPAPLFDPLAAAVAGWTGAAGAEAVRIANNAISIGAVVLFALAYATPGGLRGVVATDIGQLVIMLLSTAIFAALAWDRAGGADGLLTAIRALEARDLLGGMSATEVYALRPGLARDAGAGLIAVFALQWLLQRNADGTGYLAQRAMACRSDADARRATVWFAFLQILLRSAMWVPLGLALLVLFPPGAGLAGDALVRDREASFVVGMRELLPPGLLGLMLAAMLAALASTLDTHLNWGSSYLANDVYARLWCRGWRGREPEPRTQVWVARAGNLVVVGLALAVMTRLGSIQEAWKATLVLGAGIGAVTVLRWVWWRITAWGELAALALSFAFAPLALAWIDAEAVRMLGGAALATAAAMLVSVLGPATDRETLQRFAERVRPPGWWGPYGPPRSAAALGRALVTTGAAAVTLFASLIAALWLLVPGPRTPSPAAAVALLAVAAAALPAWVPALGRDR